MATTGGSQALANWQKNLTFNSATPSQKTAINWSKNLKANTAAAQAGVAAPTAAAPAASTAAVGPPIDPVYDAEVAGYGQQKGDTLASIALANSQALTNAGYSAQYDGSGNVTSLGFDPNNPYSQAALAQRVYKQAKTGTDNSLAARGQFTSGARVDAQNNNDFQYSAGEDARQKAVTQFLARQGLASTGAKNTYDTNVGISGANKLVRATNASYS